MTKRIQMDFQVTVTVDVDSRRPNHLAGFWLDPTEYVKRFVSVGAQVYGSHDVDFQDGKIVRAIEVVDTDVRNVEAYQI
jgi:hypothetical protein